MERVTTTPVEDNVYRFPRTMAEAFGPYAVLDEEREYDVKAEQRYAIISGIIILLTLATIACVKLR